MKTHPLDDLPGEIRAFIERETEDNIANGMTLRDAHDAALRKFGNVTLTQENTREVWIPVWVDQLRQDVRYALRMLRRNPGFTTVAVLTLALGIGLTTAVFSVVNAVLLRPLPYLDGERIMLVRETFRGLTDGAASPGHFHDWSEQSTVFEHIAAGQNVTFNLADANDPERLRGMRVTPGYFQVAQMPPAMGRYFTEEDVTRGDRVVVLSHSLWQTRFDGDSSIVGRQIRLGGESFSVVGVAPSAYALTDPSRAAIVGGFSSQLWTPLVFSPEERANYGSHTLGVLAKLKPGVSQARAQEDTERVSKGIAERHPLEMQERGVLLKSLQEQLVGSVRPQLFVLAGAAGFVLLIGCVNIASLLIARSATRRREMAIRASLGGGRSRIVRQLLTESVVLATAGGLAGLFVARGVIDFLVSRGPETLPRLREAGLQPEVLVFALAAASLAAVLFGLTPAIRAARVDLQSSLRDGGKTASSSGLRDRTRTVMIVVEIATTIVLLIGTGLMLRSAEKLRTVPLGFNSHDVLTARVTLPAVRYGNDEIVVDTFRRLLEPLRGTKGVGYAAAASHIPLVGGSGDASTFAEGSNLPPGSAPSPAIRIVTDDYFEAIGMPIVTGRTLRAIDIRPGGPKVVVINERLASALWPGESAIGKRLSTWVGPDNPDWREVIGVVRDARSFGQSAPAPMELFIPYTQAPPGAWTVFQRTMVLVMRIREDWPETYVPVVRAAVRNMDASLPVYDVRTMESIVVSSTATRRFYMRLVLTLAVTGLGLAMLGIYGVIAYFVTQRTPEIGLRRAMGAQRWEVVQMVIEQGLRTTLMGIALGVPVALALSRLTTDLLYDVKPTDLMTFVSVPVLLIVTTLVAAVIPSLKAVGVDPIVALRHE